MILLEKPDVQLLYKHTVVTVKLDKKDAAGVVNTLARLKPGTEYDFEFKERARRSLSANAYHWTLVGKIADANGTSNYEVHNQLLIDYGEDWLDEEGKRTYVLMKDDDRYMRQETVHYRPTEAVEDRNGAPYRWFILLLPSHLMDKKQMARLIDGTVLEAKALDIETRTPAEIARMIEVWEVKNGR